MTITNTINIMAFSAVALSKLGASPAHRPHTGANAHTAAPAINFFALLILYLLHP